MKLEKSGPEIRSESERPDDVGMFLSLGQEFAVGKSPCMKDIGLRSRSFNITK